MKTIRWFEREFTFGLPIGMLPFYLTRLEGTILRLKAGVKDVPEEILSNRYTDQWSVKQNIGHLAEVDEIALKRIDEMVRGVSPLSPAVFEPRQDYNAMPVNRVLEYFDTGRRATLMRYRQLAEADLMKASLHPRLKLMMTPVDLAWFDAEHDDHHLVTIHSILNQHPW